MTIQQQQQSEEARRRAEGLSYEEPFNHGRLWTDMGIADIEEFLRWHPTYFMTAKQASDWYAGVERGIRQDQDRKHGLHIADSGWTYEEHGPQIMGSEGLYRETRRT